MFVIGLFLLVSVIIGSVCAFEDFYRPVSWLEVEEYVMVVPAHMEDWPTLEQLPELPASDLEYLPPVTEWMNPCTPVDLVIHPAPVRTVRPWSLSHVQSYTDPS